MPTWCAVPKCSNSGNFRFPKDPEQRLQWCQAIRRGVEGRRRENDLWKPSEDGSDRICHRHFKEDDIITMTLCNGTRLQLKKGVIPSIFPFNEPPTSGRKRKRDDEDDDVPLVEVAQRMKEDECSKDELLSSNTSVEQNSSEEFSEAEFPDVAIEVEIQEVGDDDDDDSKETVSDDCSCASSKHQHDTHQSSKSCQASLGEKSLSVNSVLGNMNIQNLSQQQLQYYTGFLDYEHFTYVFGCLGPAADNLKYKSQLTAENEFFLTIMKLRHNKDDEELGFFFSLSRPTVARIFHTWINFLFYQLKELDLWLPKEVVKQFLPKEFVKKYPDTRIIIDGTEVGIAKPSRPKDQSATWSSYKNKNTLKVIVGISPKGVITYVSSAYGGSASDRQIVERSELLRKPLVERGDCIMADRGFHVQDLFCLHGVRINTPTYMKGISQLPPDVVEKDRQVSSQRVHIERTIGLAKTYKILCSSLHQAYVPLGGRILFVCFALSNFKPCIVPS